MRAGGCTLQQGLTTEAANIVKQALTLARHRGHAQVTPLHVANTMLSSSTGLLRTACLQSHSHPLQCKALELCFNVALNRLPASNSSPVFGSSSHHHHHQQPSISNALVAAFKRAQAHQRRGSVENQQQPLLAVKIELEQLIISILDDPSVSRVMREAGFSSTQVKSNVEQAVSLEICNSSQAPSVSTSKSKDSNINSNLSLDPGTNEDVTSVIDNLVKKGRKSVVVVGECLASIESVIRGVMGRVEKGDVAEALREVKFVTLTLSSFGNLSRVEVEHKLGELKTQVRSCVAKGVVLYVGDLKWASEYKACSSVDHKQGRGYYCPVEHAIMELGSLLFGVNDGGNHHQNISGRLWILGMATFQAYMRCKSGRPSLETVWGVHPLTIPSGSLRLSLDIPESELQSESTSNIAENGARDHRKELTCCPECSAKFEIEARSLGSSSICNSGSTTSSSLPAWLQQYKNENKVLTNDQNSAPVVSELCKKWNLVCNTMHQQQHSNNSSEKTLTLISSLSPSSSTSNFSYDQQHPNLLDRHSSFRHQHLWISGSNSNSTNIVEDPPCLRMYIPDTTITTKNPISSNPNSTPTSASSSDIVMELDDHQYVPRFKELNAENLKTLCNALEAKVPWQKDIIPEIASTILKCRSGMVRRKRIKNKNDVVKEETWLLFQGVDMEAKVKVAKELARLVFGSHKNLTSIALSSFSSTRADSTDHKRCRDETSCSYVERFAEAVKFNPHRVFLVEDVDQADYCSQMGFKRAIERGMIENSSGEEVGIGDAVVILSCESFSSRSRACSPPSKQKLSHECHEEDKVEANLVAETISPCVSLDLNISFDDDDDGTKDQSIDDIGLLESVDQRIVFRIQEL